MILDHSVRARRICPPASQDAAANEEARAHTVLVSLDDQRHGWLCKLPSQCDASYITKEIRLPTAVGTH